MSVDELEVSGIVEQNPATVIAHDGWEIILAHSLGRGRRRRRIVLRGTRPRRRRHRWRPRDVVTVEGHRLDRLCLRGMLAHPGAAEVNHPVGAHLGRACPSAGAAKNAFSKRKMHFRSKNCVPSS